MGEQAVIRDITGLFQYRIAFLDFNLNPVIMLYLLQVILVYNLLWDGCQLYPHVLVVFHRSSIIEIFDVKCAKTGTWCGYCAVE